MKYEVDAYDVTDKNGFVKRKEKMVIETVADDRHCMLCNFCESKDYPNCRSWCKDCD